VGLDVITAPTAPVATVTNVGPGLGPVIGPAGNSLPCRTRRNGPSPWRYLLGRLEFVSMLVLLLPAFWDWTRRGRHWVGLTHPLPNGDEAPTPQPHRS
jgi:Trk-type K+ transport system membrane component